MTNPELSIIEARDPEKDKDGKTGPVADIKALPYVFVVKVKLPAQSEEVAATPASTPMVRWQRRRRPQWPRLPPARMQRRPPRRPQASPLLLRLHPPPPPLRPTHLLPPRPRRTRRQPRLPSLRRSPRAAALHSRRRPSTPRCRGSRMSQKIDLKNLDFNDIGNWPQKAKIVFCSLLALVIMFVAWMLLISGKREELAGLESKEVDLRAEFTKQQERAVNLAPLKQQLAQMEQVLQQMPRQLPSKTEMPDLIIDISQTALSSGLTNELFEPEQEQVKEFYAEKPIKLRMVGSYHQFGAFVSGVASLPRVVILTMHDINLKPKDKTSGNARSGALELSGTVKTYRYLDETEVQAQQAVADAEAKRRTARGQEVMRTYIARSAVALAVLLLAACGRGVTSTPGDAPNLKSGWKASVPDRRSRWSRCR